MAIGRHGCHPAAHCGRELAAELDLTAAGPLARAGIRRTGTRIADDTNDAHLRAKGNASRPASKLHSLSRRLAVRSVPVDTTPRP